MGPFPGGVLRIESNATAVRIVGWDPDPGAQLVLTVDDQPYRTLTAGELAATDGWMPFNEPGRYAIELNALTFAVWDLN